MILPRGTEILYKEQWSKLDDSVVSNIKPHYSISTYGRIYNENTNTFLPQNIFYRKDKYITISLALLDNTHIYRQIHRLVLMSFCPIPNQELYDANHLDGVKYHNWIWNLEWSTHKNNIKHALENNLFKLGSDRENTVYDENLIHYICKLISDGLSCKEVNNIIGKDVTKLYHNIKNGHCWTHISKQYDFSNAFSRCVFNKDEVEYIIKRKKEDNSLSNRKIAIELGYDTSRKEFQYKVQAIKRILIKNNLL